MRLYHRSEYNLPHQCQHRHHVDAHLCHAPVGTNTEGTAYGEEGGWRIARILGSYHPHLIERHGIERQGG